MNLGIPRIFWYAAAFCMTALTLALITLAWRASTVSLEISSTKIQLGSAVHDVSRVADDLEQREKDLESARNQLKEQAAVLVEAHRTGAVPATLPKIPTLPTTKPVDDMRWRNAHSTLQNAAQLSKP